MTNHFAINSINATAVRHKIDGAFLATQPVAFSSRGQAKSPPATWKN